MSVDEKARSGARATKNIFFLIKKILFVVIAIVCLFPFISAPIALLLGILFSNTIGHPFQNLNNKATKKLLQFSVVGLGFGMNVESALKSSVDGLLFIIISIFGTLFFGYILGRVLRTDNKTSYLISTGTAICGGSAIAAAVPILNANENQISVSLGIVFILNSIALLIFPAVGHYLQLTEIQFGYWSAIAIHDTSSVVGAASKYGSEALEVATTVKLTRALWIIPMSIITAIIYKRRSKRIKFPWFIALFFLAMMTNNYIEVLQPISKYIVLMAKAGLTLTIFLIGTGLSYKELKIVGLRPLIQGIVLWVTISISSLLVITYMY